jgi:type II secretory pathway component PulF
VKKKYLITIIAVACVALALAAFLENLAAAFIVIVGSAIFWQNHKIEMKLNRLLARTPRMKQSSGASGLARFGDN